MITLHHLAFSRSLRILWLLEELGLKYRLVSYQRTASFTAPPQLAEIHPLGKSPVIVDGDLVLAESSAILRYVDGKYGNGTLTPPTGTHAAAIHDEWLDYVESSAALPIMLTLLGQRTGGLSERMNGFVEPLLAKALTYIANALGQGQYIMGEKLTLADIQMSYLLQVADKAGALERYPAIAAYLHRLKDYPSYTRAVEQGGPMTPPIN